MVCIHILCYEELNRLHDRTCGGFYTAIMQPYLHLNWGE